MRQILRRLVLAAYEQGWRDACNDHMEQSRNPGHPIGESHRKLDGVLFAVDPLDLLGLRK